MPSLSDGVFAMSQANANKRKADAMEKLERTLVSDSTQSSSSTNRASAGRRKADAMENYEQTSDSSSTQPSSTKKPAVDEVKEASIFKEESGLASDVSESSALASTKAYASLSNGSL
jgi:hypothetical protein